MGNSKKMIDKLKIALDVLSEAARADKQNAAVLWQAAYILLSRATKEIDQGQSESQPGEQAPLPLWAEFDYKDKSGLRTHRTIQVLALRDGHDVKRNERLPQDDRYGYLLTGYCTLRDQVRAFRSSGISNLHTFTHLVAPQPAKDLTATSEDLAA